MKGCIETISAGVYQITVYRPPCAEEIPLPILVMNLSHADGWNAYLPTLEREMIKGLVRPAMLVCVEPTDWSADFSPWIAEGLHTGDAPFSGKAPERLHLLCERILPAVRERFSSLSGSENTGIFGYSLGGLTALYALYERREFGLIGALSGSLWYDGFMEYQRTHDPLCPQARVYLSVGSKEEKTRHARMCRIGDCYRETNALLKTRLGEKNVQFDLNPGGHGTETERRILTGLRWLLKVCK